MSESSPESSGHWMGNYTPRAQQVLALARKEADRYNHNFVGTEHLLLGLIKLGQGTAVTVLQRMGLNLELVRAEVEARVRPGPDLKMVGNIPYTPRVKKVLALAAKEATALNHSYVGTEHLVLGLLREGDGVAHDVLVKFGVDVEQTREQILDVLDPMGSARRETTKEPRSETGGSTLNSQGDFIDTSKRYDIYCSERNQEIVYRNALFKSRKQLLPRHQNDFLAGFLELQLEDGKTVFVARSSVLKFCEHEVIPKPGKPAGNA